MPSVGKTYAKKNPASASSFEHAGAASASRGVLNESAKDGATSSSSPAPVVLMVSGGADSVALLVLACTAELDLQDGQGLAHIAHERLHVLHVNHQLRGVDADADEAYVRKLCERFDVPLSVERVDVAQLAEQSDDDSNIESVAREVRYKAANNLANKLCFEASMPRNSARIVTAHTANDRAETFFMNAIKGSGMQGLTSIPRRRNRIVRPLLDFTHDELCALLQARGMTWCEDVTNADTHYLRAYVRHEIVPRALERNPRLLENLSNTCDILSDEDAYLTQVSARVFQTLLMRRADGLIALDAERLMATEVVIARRVVRMAVLAIEPNCRLDAAHVAAILEIVAVRGGSVTLPGAVDARVVGGMLTIYSGEGASVLKTSGWLEVLPLGGIPNSTTVVNPGKTSYLELANCTITARLREIAPDADPVALAKAHAREWEGESVLLDAASCGLNSVGGKLWIESPQIGEVLCPLGMHGQSKKLSDLLIDEKVPMDIRPYTPVIHTDVKGKIVWVAPIRADERARVTVASRVLLELHFRGENFKRPSALNSPQSPMINL